MKKLLCFFVVGLSFLCGRATHAELVTAVAVVVNGSVITLGEIAAKVQPGMQIMARTYGNDQPRLETELQKMRDEAIEQMVEDKLILHEFITSGYVTNVLEAFINDRINEEIQKEYYGDRSRLIRTLKEQGKTYETYRREKRERFIIDYMNYQNSSNPRKIVISPLKIEQYYQSHPNEFKVQDQVKLRMIVLTNSPDIAPDSTKRLAEEILAKVDSGVPFAEMAAVNSSGSHRSEGGDRGWVDHTYFKEALDRVAFTLKPGQHSGVIEQPEACYLMMVEEVKPAHVKTLNEVRADIERTLKNDENLRLRKLWIERLKRKSFVNYY